jgi:hypothetical protein
MFERLILVTRPRCEQGVQPHAGDLQLPESQQTDKKPPAKWERPRKDSMERSIFKRLRTKVLNGVWTLSGRAAPSQALSLDDWLAAGGDGRAFDIAGPQTVTCPPRMMRGNVAAIPSTIEKLPNGFNEVYKAEWPGTARISFPAERVAELRNGRVFSSLGMIVGSNDVQISDVSGGTFSGLFDIDLVHEGRVPNPRRIRGSVAVLASGLSQRNYYHWVVESLPRLRLLEEAGVAPDYYYIPARYPFHRLSLEALGINPKRFIFARKFTHIQADTLYACTRPRMEMTPQNAAYLYRLLAGQPWSKTESTPRRNLYIARKACDPRNVMNEGEVLAALKPWGFTKHYLEDLTVREQIELFQQADFVIGPHGAGLVNTVFCRPGTCVIEIGTPVRPSALFYYIAHHRGLRYSNFYGQAVRSKRDESHIRVLAAELAACVEELLCSSCAAA